MPDDVLLVPAFVRLGFVLGQPATADSQTMCERALTPLLHQFCIYCTMRWAGIAASSACSCRPVPSL